MLIIWWLRRRYAIIVTDATTHDVDCVCYDLQHEWCMSDMCSVLRHVLTYSLAHKMRPAVSFFASSTCSPCKSKTYCTMCLLFLQQLCLSVCKRTFWILYRARASIYRYAIAGLTLMLQLTLSSCVMVTAVCSMWPCDSKDGNMLAACCWQQQMHLGIEMSQINCLSYGSDH